MGAFRLRKPVPRPSLQTGYVAAPIGGINTVDVATQMPAKDAIYCWNMVPAEYGLRSRLGYQEWYNDGGGSGEARTIVPFTGNTANGAGDRLFFAMTGGLLDVTTSGTAPSGAGIAFAVTTGSAGYGITLNFSAPGGRYCVYTDEENGLHYYSEAAGTWAKLVLGTSVLWKFSTPYRVGDKVVNGANVYVVTAAGTSAASGGPTGTGTGIVDGGVTWNYVSAKGTNVIGPSLADQRAGFSGDPANFVACCVWKNRLLLVEKNSTRVWYLGINAVYGEATSFDMGTKFKAGGPLVNAFNWSYDGGSGMQTLLVGVSTGGDVVIYGGSDIALDIALQGCWSLGGVPSGRRIATDNGGDILVLSSVGIVPLSKLVTGKQVAGEADTSRSVYETAKIGNLFNVLASTRRTLPGWAMHVHPTDNTLLVLVPNANGIGTEQLAMSFATKAWGRYRDLPMLCAGVWNGQLYFGTVDGRVCINTGYVDNVLLADSNTYSPIAWSILTGYDNLGSASYKKVEVLVPEMVSETPNPEVESRALYDLSLTEPALPSGSPGLAKGTWDNATWDASQWAGEYTPSIQVQGGAGLGRSVAIAARGNAISRTVLAGFHVMFNTGGPL